MGTIGELLLEKILLILSQMSSRLPNSERLNKNRSMPLRILTNRMVGENEPRRVSMTLEQSQWR